MAIYAEAKSIIAQNAFKILSDWLFLTWDFSGRVSYSPSQAAIEMFRLLLGIFVEV